ncbi:MAG: YraN family protein [Bacteroidales bacterium]
MNDIHHQDLGALGEDLATAFLQQKGYAILHRNWHFGHKELDIVAKDNGMLVIVEVKTRANDYWEEPKEAVKRKKQKRIIDAADAYVQYFDLDIEVRFDIVSVVWHGGQHTIEHIEDAFYPLI